MRIPNKIALKGFLYVLLVGSFVVTGYIYRDTYRTKLPMVVQSIRQVIRPAPCTDTITFNIGDLDQRFGLSQAKLISNMKIASKAWNDALGKEILVYSTTSPEVSINLIYDYRQQATSKLQELGGDIEDDKATYDVLKSRYNSLNTRYQNEKIALENAINDYNNKKAQYEQEVEKWNRQGGAPPAQYEKLKTELDALNTQGEAIRERQVVFNELVSTINATVSSLNRLAATLNLQVENYNRIGSSTGEEFNEGEYIEDINGKRIDIYQYTTNDELVRVLMHEFGHALGLEHVENEESVMHRLNSSENLILTANDLGELARVCTNSQ